jgi:hypothetical protein
MKKQPTVKRENLNSITDGITDTVFLEGKTCLRIRNQGEMLIVQAHPEVSDEELIETFAAYLKWRRGHPPPRVEIE